jgi:hypothetical protein
VFAQVKTLDFRLRRQPKSYELIDRLKQDPAHHKDVYTHGHHTDGLGDELTCVPSKQAIRPTGVDRLGSEESDAQRADASTHSMDTDDIQAVIISKSRLSGNREITATARQ